MAKATYFCSTWQFLPHGVKYIKDKFEEAVKKGPWDVPSYVDYNYESHMWLIESTVMDAEELFEVFHSIVEKLIEKESAKIDEENGNEDDSGSGDDETFKATSNLIQDLPNPPKHDNTAFPDELKSFKFKATWICEHPHKVLGDVVTAKTIEEIKILTDSHLVMDLNSQLIYIGAQLGSSCAMAMYKLDVILKHWSLIPQYGLPNSVEHVFYSEHHEKFQTTLRMMDLVKKKMSQTTLLDTETELGHKVDRLLKMSHVIVVRACLFNRELGIYSLKGGEKLFPAVNQNTKALTSDGWGEYKYRSKGDETSNPMRHFSSMPEESLQGVLPDLSQTDKYANVEKWAMNLPENLEELDESMEDIPELQEDEAESASMASVVTGFLETPTKQHLSTATNYTHHRPAPIIVRRSPPPGYPSMHTPIPFGHATRPSLDFSPAPQHQGFMSPNDAILYETFDLTHRPLLESSPVQQHQSLISSNTGITQSTSAYVGRSLLDDSPVQQRQILRSSNAGVPSTYGIRSLLDLSPDEQHRDMRSLAAGISQPPPTYAGRSLLDSSPELQFRTMVSSRVANLQGSSMMNNGTVNRGGVSGHILDMDEDLGSSMPAALIPTKKETDPPSINPEDEINSRVYHRTMGQRAPRPDKSVSKGDAKAAASTTKNTPYAQVSKPRDPIDVFMRDIGESILEALPAMRGWRGTVKLEAQIGRHLIHRLSLRHVEKAKLEFAMPHTTEYLEAVLTKDVADGGPVTDMTKIVSTSLLEGKFVAHLENDAGHPIWNTSEPPTWTVTYELKFRSSSQYFSVLINAETFEFEVKSAPVEFVVSYVHCMLRSWDYRLVANGSENLSVMYNDLARCIVDSLYVPPDLTTPSIVFEIANSFLDDGITLLSCRTLRKCQHTSTDGKSKLHITEVHNMAAMSRQDQKKDRKVVAAFLKTVLAEGESATWVEFSVSSTELDGMFLENEALELGAESSWIETDISKGKGLAAVYLRANELVRKMDGVGFYNDNGTRPEPKSAFGKPAKPSAMYDKYTGRALMW